jgi:hypothetical protein
VDFPADPIHGAGTTSPIHMGEPEDGCCSNGVPYKQYDTNISRKIHYLTLI